MELQELTKQLNVKAVHDGAQSVDVTGGYASDLLSDVLAKAKPGNVLVTNQKHINVVAVASLLGLSGVIMAGGVEPDENAVEKAEQEGVSLFVSDATAFDIVGRMYSLGIRSNAD